MKDVFISYARNDGEIASLLKHRLGALGLSVFYDVDGGVSAGDTFPQRISDAVLRAKVVLACWTPHSLTRPWVRRECMMAREFDKLVPVACEPLAAIDLKEFIDASYEDLSDFRDQDRHLGWSRTLSAIAQKMVAWAEANPDDADAISVGERAGAVQQAALAARRGLADHAPRRSMESEMSRLWSELEDSIDPGRLIRFADSFPNTKEAFQARERANHLQDEIKAERTLNKSSLMDVLRFIEAWPNHHNLAEIEALVPELKVAERTERRQRMSAEARQRREEQRERVGEGLRVGVRIAYFTAPIALTWFGLTWVLRSFPETLTFPWGITITPVNLPIIVWTLLGALVVLVWLVAKTKEEEHEHGTVTRAGVALVSWTLALGITFTLGPPRDTVAVDQTDPVAGSPAFSSSAAISPTQVQPLPEETTSSPYTAPPMEPVDSIFAVWSGGESSVYVEESAETAPSER